jgi:hypothetical protein
MQEKTGTVVAKVQLLRSCPAPNTKSVKGKVDSAAGVFLLPPPCKVGAVSHHGVGFVRAGDVYISRANDNQFADE